MFRFSKSKLAASMKRWFANEAGVVALAFALSMPVFIAAAGISLDMAQAYNVRARLSNALDKAALAAGSMHGTEAEIEAKMALFFDANYPEDKLGAPYDIEIELEEGTITVSAKARVDTSFMAILGYEYIDVSQRTIVRRELKGVEAVLVLDVTGSMAGNNIAALKTASHTFIDTMFGRISNLEYLKIGIVPFSVSVNVGRYGLGLTPEGDSYGSVFVDHPATDSYVSPASNITYGTGSTNWRGCILERASPKDTNDDATPNWGMYRYPRICSRYNSNGTCRTWSNNNANTNCTSSGIIPLTNDQVRLETAIDNLSVGGGTYIPIGTIWGWRVISPDAPFTEGVSYNDPDWNKFVIIMTDGNNEPDNTYSAYGANPGLTAGNLNTKFATICSNMKAAGVVVYTVTFQSGITNATRDIFRQCASDTTKYFNAPTNASLQTAFRKIANELSQLHIVE